MASKRIFSAAAANFGLIANQMNVRSSPVSLIKHAGSIPGGFPYSAFNGAARIRPESILSVIESTRASVFNKTSSSDYSALDFDKLYKDYFIFIVGCSLQVDERFYDVGRCKGPLSFDVELVHIGSTSSRLKTRLFLEDFSDPMVVSHVSSVSICNKTRQPKGLPAWWLEKYRSLLPKEGNPAGKQNLSGGTKSLTTESQFRISLSDVDAYRHTNWSTYLRFCHDAFGQHKVDKLGSAGYEDYFYRSIKDFAIGYQKESSAGDVIKVKVSPESSSPANDVFYFSVENESGNVLCQSRIQYYPS